MHGGRLLQSSSSAVERRSSIVDITPSPADYHVESAEQASTRMKRTPSFQFSKSSRDTSKSFRTSGDTGDVGPGAYSPSLTSDEQRSMSSSIPGSDGRSSLQRHSSFSRASLNRAISSREVLARSASPEYTPGPGEYSTSTEDLSTKVVCVFVVMYVCAFARLYVCLFLFLCVFLHVVMYVFPAKGIPLLPW